MASLIKLGESMKLSTKAEKLVLVTFTTLAILTNLISLASRATRAMRTILSLSSRELSKMSYCASLEIASIGKTAAKSIRNQDRT